MLCASRTAADVAALARDVTAAGGEGVPAVCDLQAPESLSRFAEDSPDLVVAAQTMGGRFGALPLVEIPSAELAQSLAAYPQGTWNLLRAVGPAMLARGRGSFLQIGTSSGVRTKEGYAGARARGRAARAARSGAGGGARVADPRRPRRVPPGRRAHRLGADCRRQPLRGTGHLTGGGCVAEACAFLYGQSPDAWTHELVLRPIGGDWPAPT